MAEVNKDEQKVNGLSGLMDPDDDFLIYMDGRRAQQAGKTLAANPHPMSSDAALAWSQGWLGQ